MKPQQHKIKIRVFERDPIVTILELLAVGISLYLATTTLLNSAGCNVFLDSGGRLTIGVVALLLTSFCIIYFIIRHSSKLYIYIGENEGLAVFLKKNNQQVKIVKYTLWWNYIYGRVLQNQVTGYKTVVGNRISIWLELQEESGSKIIINQRLPPWSKNVRGINYSNEMEFYANNKDEDEKYLRTYHNLLKVDQFCSKE